MSVSDSAPKEEVPQQPEAPAEAPKAAPVEKVASTKAAPQPPVVSTSNGRVVASPLAKKMAADKGIDLARIQGSGDHGRIVKRDLENYQPSVMAMMQGPTGVEQITELANSQMRKTIAKRLSASKFSAPHYYLGVEFDMDAAISFLSLIHI